METDWEKVEIENRGLTVRSVQFLGEGWNSRAYLVNDELAFRFPKRAEHWEELRREMAFLAFVADALPLAAPRYLTAVPDSPATAHGYAVYRYLRGVPLDLHALSPIAREAAGVAIAGFLRAMHGLQPGADAGFVLPREDERTVAHDYLTRAERAIMPKLRPAEALALRKRFDDYLGSAGNFQFRPAVLHADFSADHVLVESGAVVAVIDFGDVNWGDPDYDFMYLFVDFGWSFVEEVARRYGHPNLEQLQEKVRYYAIVDQIGTILDGAGRALAGQEDTAWCQLRQFLQS